MISHSRRARAATMVVLAVLAAVGASPVLGSRPQSGQTPPRDWPPIVITGTAGVSGIVVTDDAERTPLRRVLVRLSRSGVEDIRTTATDDEGRYRIDALAADTYTLSFTKGAYISMDYGASRAGLTGQPVVIGEGEQWVARPIAMLRGSVIAGRVMEPDGRPVGEGVSVRASQFVDVKGVRKNRVGWGTNSSATTNGHGEYRIFGLLPGEYLVYVAAAGSPVPSPPTPAELRWAEQPAGSAPPGRPPSMLAPTLFPSTTDSAAAVAIPLARSEERLGIDVTLQSVSVASIRGLVVGADGRPAAGVVIWRTPQRTVPFTLMASSAARTDSSGAFEFRNVPPGEYVLTARGGPGVTRMIDGVERTVTTQWAQTGARVAGQDLHGVSLTLQPGLTVAGRVVFAGGTTPSWPITAVRIQLSSVTDAPQPLGAPAVVVQPDGTFTIEGVIPGVYRARVTFPASAEEKWFTKSAMHAGRDLVDVPVEIAPGGNLSDLVVTLTGAPARLSGNLANAAGQPAEQLSVFVFSTDPAHWWSGSRRVQTTLTNDAGAYVITGLPAGEYYLCALTEVDRLLMHEDEYLTQLVPASIKIAIADGEQRIQHLRVGG
jgi:hypothetical protein